MRRRNSHLKRQRFILLVISLALSAATSAMWLRSYASTDLVGRWSERAQAGTIHETCSGIFSHRGAVAIASYHSQQSAAEYQSNNGAFTAFRRAGWISDAPSYPVGLRDEFSILGFYYARNDGLALHGSTLQDSRDLARVPYWFLLILLALYPRRRALLGYRAYCRSQRHALARCCRTCGYDLRATPNRCPECGAVPQATAAA